MYQSKGIESRIALVTRHKLQMAIIDASKLYWVISSLTNGATGDPRPDLIVDECIIDEYANKQADAVDYCARFNNTETTLNRSFRLEENDDISDITVMKHRIQYADALSELCAFMIWLYRLLFDSYDQMVRSIISYMRDVYVHQISDGDRDDYRRLVDMIERMSVIIDDLRARAIDGKYVVTDDAIGQLGRLIATILEGGMAYDLRILTLAFAVAIYQAKADIDHDSMSVLIDMLSAIASTRMSTSSVMEISLRRLVFNAFAAMTCRLEWSVEMADYAPVIEELRSDQKEIRNHLKAHLGNRPSTAPDTMDN